MAVLNKQEFFDAINNQIGSDTSDASIAFLDNMQDTYNDLERRLTENEGQDWKAKYDELDNAWRQKYKRRFFSNGGNGNPDDAAIDKAREAEQRANNITIDDLFQDTTGKGKEV